MKNTLILFISVLALFSCKEEKKEITVFGTNIGDYAPTFTAPTPDVALAVTHFVTDRSPGAA